jgi:hypothetical protein
MGGVGDHLSVPSNAAIDAASNAQHARFESIVDVLQGSDEM